MPKSGRLAPFGQVRGAVNFQIRHIWDGNLKTMFCVCVCVFSVPIPSLQQFFYWYLTHIISLSIQTIEYGNIERFYIYIYIYT